MMNHRRMYTLCRSVFSQSRGRYQRPSKQPLMTSITLPQALELASFQDEDRDGHPDTPTLVNRTSRAALSKILLGLMVKTEERACTPTQSRHEHLERGRAAGFGGHCLSARGPREANLCGPIIWGLSRRLLDPSLISSWELEPLILDGPRMRPQRKIPLPDALNLTISRVWSRKRLP